MVIMVTVPELSRGVEGALLHPADRLLHTLGAEFRVTGSGGPNGSVLRGTGLGAHRR